MENALLIGLSRQMAMTREMATIANNLANMNTTAYKSEAMLFEQFLMPDASEESAGGNIAFVQDYGQHRNMRDGAIQTTANPFDVAIAGEGFFRVQTETGVLYTRNGHFSLDAEGQLATSTGALVLTDAGAPIRFAQDETGISIARDGKVSAASLPSFPSKIRRTCAMSATPCSTRPRRKSPLKTPASCRARSKARTCSPSSR